MTLRIKHTRNSPDVLLREFFWSFRFVNTGNCNDEPDKFTLSFDIWHFVQDGGRLFKLFSYEFAAWSDLTMIRYFNFCSVCPAQVCVVTVTLSLLVPVLVVFPLVSFMQDGLGRFTLVIGSFGLCDSAFEERQAWWWIHVQVHRWKTLVYWLHVFVLLVCVFRCSTSLREKQMF